MKISELKKQLREAIVKCENHITEMTNADANFDRNVLWHEGYESALKSILELINGKITQEQL